MHLIRLLLFFSIFSSSCLYSQSFVVTGKVTSSENKPLDGVSVRLKNASVGVTTDNLGNYKVAVTSATGTLVFSSVGFIVEEVPINSQSSINIILKEVSKQLDDVVVIGYGAVRKKDLTGSVAQVRSKEIGIFANNSPVQALQGRAAGVQVTQNSGSPGGSISVRIRGTNSVQGSNEPLYVVDGFPLNGSLNILNNADIESIEVLKDASAIAIYGSRGANGVVLVTTKKGKVGAVRVDYESGYTIQKVSNKLKLMNPKQYAEFYNEQAKNDNLTPYFTQSQVDSLGGVKGTDWQDLVLRNAPQTNNIVTVSGGSGKTRFSVSGGIFKQGGIIRNSDYNRYSLRANIDQDISSKFSLSYSTNLSRINSARQNSAQGNRGSSTISAMESAPPIFGPYINGVYRNLATSATFVSNVLQNPVANINESSDNLRANRILANAAVIYKPVPGLSIRISGGRL